MAGPGATILHVVGYFVTADLRGFGANPRYVAFWTVSGLVGGPVFGWAGRAWREARPAGVGGALLAAVFIAEGLTFEIRLDFTSTAVLFVGIGTVLALALGLHRRQLRSTLLWCPVLTALGGLGLLTIVLLETPLASWHG